MRWKKSLLALVLLVGISGVARADDPATKGPHEITKVDFSASSPYRTSKDMKIPIEVVMPKDATGPVPVIFISHGWTDGKSSFDHRAEHYASRGFAAVLVEQPLTTDMDVHGWVANLRAAIDEVEKRNGAKDGDLAGKLDMSRLGVEGHSLGGAAVVIAAAEDPRIKAVVADAPGAPLALHDYYEAARKLTVPLQVQAAQLDTVVPAPMFARPIFDYAEKAASRLYVEIAGAHHLAWSDTPFLSIARNMMKFVPSFSALLPFTDIDRALPLSLRYSTAWFEEKLNVRDDRSEILGARVPGLSDHRAFSRTIGLGAALEDRVGAAKDTVRVEER
jgi:predicted dienelactone hydrolase